MKTRSNMPLFVVECEDVKALSNAQIDLLRCGDYLVKKDASGEHAYKVTFKSDTGMCITYHDASVIETQSYDKIDGVWTYNSEDKTPNLLELFDEDIVANIVYDFEHKEVIFPKGVLPLRIHTHNDHTFYFNYNDGEVVDEEDSFTLDYVANNIDNVYIDDAEGELFIAGGVVDDAIDSIEYVMFNGNHLELNAYNLYHAPAGGTKLYKHTINFDTDIDTGQVIYVISTESTPYTPATLSNDVNNILAVHGVIEYEGTYYVVTQITKESTFALLYGFNTSGPAYGTAGVEVINSDTVTEL